MNLFRGTVNDTDFGPSNYSPTWVSQSYMHSQIRRKLKIEYIPQKPTSGSTSTPKGRQKIGVLRRDVTKSSDWSHGLKKMHWWVSMSLGCTSDPSCNHCKPSSASRKYVSSQQIKTSTVTSASWRRRAAEATKAPRKRNFVPRGIDAFVHCDNVEVASD